MPSSAIRCPHCKQEIELTETLTGQIKSDLQSEFETKLQVQKAKLWILAQAKAEEKTNLELQDLKIQTAEREQQLEVARKNELTLRAETRLLEAKTKNLDLELERKLDIARKEVEAKLKTEQSSQLEDRLKTIQADFRMKELEKDKQMEILKRSLDEAQRKSAQASMQIQGEVQEADLKRLLETRFPLDTINDVPTGIKGADLIQTVTTQFGQTAGIILWESKNTKQWSSDWIKKLKGDQAIAVADVCILVSKVLPDTITSFGYIEGVWVLDAAYVIPVTTMLRQNLIQLSQAKNSLVGQATKKDYLYEYISSPQFRNRLENIMTGFKSLQEDLDTEKRSMQRIWSKREKEIERVMDNTSNMYGDMQGIIGASLPTVPLLELAEVGDTDEPANLTLL